jgi:hypothetical protein
MMAIDNLSSLIATVLAVSLASERLVTVIKTALPRFLSEETGAGIRPPDPFTDRPRRLSVQLLAFVSSWLTAGFIAEGGVSILGWQPLGHVMVSASQSIPAWIIGVLGSGGSALWNNLLGYSKAAKDIRIQERVSIATPHVRIPLTDLRQRVSTLLTKDENAQPPLGA